MAFLRTSVLRKRSVRIIVRCVIAAVTVGLVTTAALAATSSHPSTYRTATVTRAAVNETLEQTGTIQPVSQATVAFPTSGAIATVGVAVGDTVATGQTLAKLDTTALQATLTAKESTLADAELTLQKALNGESSGPAGGNGSSTNAVQQAATTTTTTTAPSAAPTGTADAAANAKLTAARNAVTKAETAVRAALTAAQRALAAATHACNTTTTTTSTTTPTTTSTTTVAPAPPTSCATAEAALFNAQRAVADAENTFATAETKLAAILAGTSTPTGGSSNSKPATTPTTAPSNTTSGSTITADQLVADEASVAAALADVNAANETLAQATIVSPIAGAVAAVNLSVGTQVSADSSTANVVIVGRGGYEVTTTVTVADRPKVAIGDAATVTPDGSSTKLAGKVVAIGLPVTSGGTSSGATSNTTSSTTSYPVTIGFTGEPAGLRNGASGTVVIVVAHTDSALTVPTSGVTTIGTTRHTVTVLANGKTSIVAVEIGTVGADRTAVTSGLTAGQTVVLADLGQAIPSSNATTRFGGGGAFGGSGLTGGGGGGFGRGG